MTACVAFLTAIFRVFTEEAEPDCVFAVLRAAGVVRTSTGAGLTSSAWACRNALPITMARLAAIGKRLAMPLSLKTLSACLATPPTSQGASREG